MQGIFDTHTHFSDEAYRENDIETEELISDAKLQGVDKFCCVGYDVPSSKDSVRYALKYQGVYAAVGIHPNHAHEINQNDIEEIELLAHADGVVAIGEIGLDYYYTDEYKEIQKEVFIKQIEIALKNDKVVMMHIRDKNNSEQAYIDALEILEKFEVKRAIVHCYTRGYELAQKFIEKGYYISIPGVITFKNATDLQEAVQNLSLNNIIVETDAPYLTPEPNRGKLNSSKEIVHTVEKIAKLKNLNKDDVAEITSKNAKQIFNIE